ncbi:Vesicle transport protein SFT2C [Camelus dromedarius]|uniref:Vesicle transport protein SFT2C n=1 Tax=Camelus dromedarius TaxID=9838 RepID=A0A5N4E635_CAMDR|nr:Vesicle transport protein SFT2C [Camelus dromedarius]
MADLHRQLQEYLSQGKAGGPAAAEPLLSAEEAEKPAAGAGRHAPAGGAACETPAAACEEAPSRPALLYVAALGATLYAALWLRSTLFTALGACAQVGALLAALFGLLPRGAGTALRLALGRLGPGAALAKALPV